jgi:hypothetical protein
MVEQKDMEEAVTENQKAMAWGVVLGAALMGIVLSLITVGSCVDARSVREAAVKGGYARWEVVDLNTGATEFRWNAPAEKKP